MSQRNSEYARLPADAYQTPRWVTEALLPHLPRAPMRVWEPACGEGQMIAVLGGVGTDLKTGNDFLCAPAPDGIDAIITNPPYNLATEFITTALARMQGVGGMVAMLLRTDFDHAKGRQHLFGIGSAFAKKLVLTRRIRWFADSKGSPSFNHAWFIWDWQHRGSPTIAYAH